MEFVNLNGEPVSTSAVKRAAKRAEPKADESWHKGFRVVGIPPGAYEKAVEENAKQQASDRLYGSEARPDLPPYEQWANQFTPKPVRAKPYEIPDAADVCADLAKKAGWDRVVIVELKHIAQKI